MMIIKKIKKNKIIHKIPKMPKLITQNRTLILSKSFRIISIIYHFQYQIIQKLGNLNQKLERLKVFLINLEILKV